MFKSQKLKTFFLHFFLVGVVSVCWTSNCDAQNFLLAKGDSLFKEKKFTEAFNVYSELDKSGTASPAMYLKMAYINEALGDISGTMFYLNKYYLLSKNKLVLKKMEKLAEKNELQGYDYSDFEFAENLLVKFGSSINLVFSVLVFMLFALILYRWIKFNRYSKNLAIATLVLTIILIVNNGFSLTRTYGIIDQDYSFIMNAPSAGANKLMEVNKGNRFQISNYDEVWAKVEADQDAGYVRFQDFLILKESQSPTLWIIDYLKTFKKRS